MSSRAQQKAKYWPTPKAYAALDGTTTEADLADLFERSILDEALRQMRTWTPEEIIEILQDAATILVTLRDTSLVCDFCDEEFTGEPVKDPEWVAWLGDSAPPFCSQTCLDAHDEQRINAAGNAS